MNYNLELNFIDVIVLQSFKLEEFCITSARSRTIRNIIKYENNGGSGLKASAKLPTTNLDGTALTATHEKQNTFHMASATSIPTLYKLSSIHIIKKLEPQRIISHYNYIIK